MKQILSGKDWLVSHFLPGEVSAANNLISRISSGELYGGEFIPATVPGDVQSDALDAGIIDDINYGFNARKAEWTYQRDWVYVKRFTPLAHDKGRIRLCFDGVDYAAEVYLDRNSRASPDRKHLQRNCQQDWAMLHRDATDKHLRICHPSCDGSPANILSAPIA